MSQLATFTEYYNYFSGIATSHVDINGFKFGEKEVMQCGARSDLTLPILWAESYDPVRILDNKSDNHTGQLSCVIYILDNKPEAWADQRTKYEAMEVIAKQILAKILKDFNDGALQADLNGYRYGWVEPVFGSTPAIGVRMDLSFLRPERLVYNAAKWQ